MFFGFLFTYCSLFHELFNRIIEVFFVLLFYEKIYQVSYQFCLCLFVYLFYSETSFLGSRSSWFCLDWSFSKPSAWWQPRILLIIILSFHFASSLVLNPRFRESISSYFLGIFPSFQWSLFYWESHSFLRKSSWEQYFWNPANVKVSYIYPP